MMDGHGKLWFATGDRYEGDFKQNQLEGHGKYTLGNGDCCPSDTKQDAFACGLRRRFKSLTCPLHSLLRPVGSVKQMKASYAPT
jgi:hypothetical protein